jgi:hypothetical protein
MNYTAISAAVAMIIACACGPASARSMSCAEVDNSKMTRMIDAMADGPHKWEMYRHLAEINYAMSRDGNRGCDTAMANIMKRMKLDF